jgi:UDP-N-acetylmuramoylalanine--D-glutamate ligase
VNYRNYFKNKRITVMGLGLLGRGIGVIKFLAGERAELTVTDLKTAEQLAPALKQLSKYKNPSKGRAGITYHLGAHDLNDFKNKDLIIRAPNAPLDSVYLKEAEKNGIEVDQDASLFCKLAPAGVKIIGITGTRGKSTVTHLLYEILVKAGKKVYLAGNVRGTATLPLLKKVKAGDYVVMELDSWQLQSFNTFSPHLAIFTTFMNDHQNYYRGSMERYFADKANIFTHQTKDDVLIAGSQVAKMIKAQKPKGKLIIPKQSLLAGKHREYNAALAMAAAKELGVKEMVIKKAVKNFKGLPGRLEFIKNIKGVKYYNDTTATTPDAVMAAVHALKDYKGKIILIGGGTDKELDFKRYGQIVPKYLKELILFEGSATTKILAILPLKWQKQAVMVKNMPDAVKCATSLAEKGDLVLLSPGAASFGIFKNEFDRGDQFNKLVSKIK